MIKDCSQQTVSLYEDITVLDGEIDIANLYAPVVEVNRFIRGRASQCSGVLIDPRLVLTAGHCVCNWQQEVTGNPAHATMSSLGCAKSVTVTATLYDPLSSADNPVAATRANYRGAVQPNPGLSLVRNQVHRATLSSRADLAVIVLDKPVDGPFLSVPLAEAEILADEPITIVGYGNVTLDGGMGLRRFGRNRCARFLANDREKFKIEKPGALALGGDSGGPSFREGPQGLELVGIASKSVAGEDSTFTSTFFHREWLLQEIRNVADEE